MGGLPVATAFDLCGEEAAIEAARKRAAQRKSSAGRAAAAERERAQQLAQVLERDIIPKLVMAHDAAQPAEDAERPQGWRGLGPETAEKFALLSLSAGQDGLMAVVGALLQQGAPMEAIYLDLLGPAARRLGDYWLEDRISYADVTIALGKLQVVVHELSLSGPHTEGFASEGRSALFAPVPGEQHTFGLSILAEFFRRAGWRTWSEVSGNPEEVLRAAQAHHFDVVGLSISCEDYLAQLRPVVMSIRRASRNPDIVVLVGGRLVAERPEIAADVGADLCAADARQALLGAEGAIRQLARR